MKSRQTWKHLQSCLEHVGSTHKRTLLMKTLTSNTFSFSCLSKKCSSLSLNHFNTSPHPTGNKSSRLEMLSTDTEPLYFFKMQSNTSFVLGAFLIFGPCTEQALDAERLCSCFPLNCKKFSKFVNF